MKKKLRKQKISKATTTWITASNSITKETTTILKINTEEWPTKSTQTKTIETIKKKTSKNYNNTRENRTHKKKMITEKKPQ